MRIHVLLLILLWGSILNIIAQEKEFHVKLIDSEINIDGILDEDEWQMADRVTDFWQYFPTDSVLSKMQSEIYILYDKKYIYVGIKIYSVGNKYIIPSLKRDYLALGNDNISLLFDTFNDGSNAFFFGINPHGIRREALISGGGSDFRQFDPNWDVKWIGESKIFENYYTSELKIPLSAFKFNEGTTKWRFNSYRFDTQSNEWSSWTRIPQNQTITNLAFMGNMIFENPLKKTKSPLAIIPYVKGVLSQNFDSNENTNKLDFGGDVKIPIGNSLNLDLTVNPDFSQVEADELLVNLTRFELLLPEKRQFFIDNRDLFGNFGDNRDANPFFSRRIGIASDLEGDNIENKLLAGLRFSGKLNENLRLGVLNVQTAEDNENEIPNNNNTVIAVQQKLFSRSNVGFIFVNRQVTKDRDFVSESEQYNRVFGIDFNLATEDNKWMGKTYVHKSFTPQSGPDDYSSGAFLEYNTRKINTKLGANYIGKDFQSDLGFIRRTDIFKIDPRIKAVFYPENSQINSNNFSLRYVSIWSPELDFLNTDYEIDLEWEVRFKEQSNFEIALNTQYTYLLEDFDPTDSDGGVPLPAKSSYNYSRIDITYGSDIRNPFSFTARVDAGQFFNGHKISLTSDFRLRLQPYFTASIRSNYNYIELPQPHPTASIWLIGPKFEFTFTKNIYWSTFVQYSSQLDNFSVNSRLQWRFKPLSDLFFVYNDNYRTTVFSPRSRAVILKFTYWINI